jgi:5-formyltetrahydrofolate cyclo-ligase
MSDVSEQKVMLRRELRARLRTIPAAELAREGEQLRERLLRQPEWRQARSVMLFASMPEEPDLWPLAERALAEGRRLALPRFDRGAGVYAAATVRDLAQDVQMGSFGIREPVAICPVCPLNQLDLVLVPGLGFDREGHRLGRGKGFYDRMLSSRRGAACGVAMDWQILPAIPVEPHDQHVDFIVTPSRWLAVVRRS